LVGAQADSPISTGPELPELVVPVAFRRRSTISTGTLRAVIGRHGFAVADSPCGCVVSRPSSPQESKRRTQSDARAGFGAHLPYRRFSSTTRSTPEFAHVPGTAGHL
jgi:hypothetical protein